MVAAKGQEEPYLLSYRREDVEEDRRLNSQHDVIKHGILDGTVIHSSIPATQITGAIADLGCGTGIWLEDLKRTLFDVSPTAGGKLPLLVGFDVNPHAFNKNPASGVQLIVHDCTKSFDATYIGKFDLVHINALAYALSAEGFSRLIQNAVQLLSQAYVNYLIARSRKS